MNFSSFNQSVGYKGKESCFVQSNSYLLVRSLAGPPPSLLPPPIVGEQRNEGWPSESPLSSWKPSREVLTRYLSLRPQISEKGQSHHGPRRLFFSPDSTFNVVSRLRFPWKFHTLTKRIFTCSTWKFNLLLIIIILGKFTFTYLRGGP